MKYSENWLREWVNPNQNGQVLADTLTMAGLEVDAILPAAETFTGVIIGRILECKPHPEVNTLYLTQVDVGIEKLLPIVCGASNVAKNMKVAVALENAQLPGNKTISTTTIAGEFS